MISSWYSRNDIFQTKPNIFLNLPKPMKWPSLKAIQISPRVSYRKSVEKKTSRRQDSRVEKGEGKVTGQLLRRWSASLTPSVFLSLQNIQWRSETIKEETTSVCLKREFSEEDARQLGLGRRIGVGRGYDSPVARETKTREPGLDASCPRQPGAEVCTQPVSPPSQLQLATFQHAASSRLYGL